VENDKIKLNFFCVKTGISLSFAFLTGSSTGATLPLKVVVTSGIARI